jgi:hypothetical protein
MENVCNRQSKFLYLAHDPLSGASRIDYDRLLRHRIANDRAVATKGRYRKCFSDHEGHDTCMLPSKPPRAQGTVFLLFRTLRGANNGASIAGCTDEGQFVESSVDKSG